jgi:regulatory protein
VNVYLDGEFAFGLSRLVAAWLKVGQEISDEKIAGLKADDELETTYQKALHFLSYRPRSAAEVRQNLTKRNIPETVVEATILRLQRAGWVDDAAFARAWVENRSEFRPRSKSALHVELRRKGLDDELIRSVDAARKYLRRVAGLEWPEFRRKLGGFLARRGFSYSTLSPVVSKVWEESRMADDEGYPDEKD